MDYDVVGCLRKKTAMPKLAQDWNSANHGQPVWLSYTSPSRFLCDLFHVCEDFFFSTLAERAHQKQIQWIEWIVYTSTVKGFDKSFLNRTSQTHRWLKRQRDIAANQRKVWRTPSTPFSNIDCRYYVHTYIDRMHAFVLLISITILSSYFPCSGYTFHVPFHSNVRFCLNYNNV